MRYCASSAWYARRTASPPDARPGGKGPHQEPRSEQQQQQPASSLSPKATPAVRVSLPGGRDTATQGWLSDWVCSVAWRGYPAARTAAGQGQARQAWLTRQWTKGRGPDQTPASSEGLVPPLHWALGPPRHPNPPGKRGSAKSTGPTSYGRPGQDRRVRQAGHYWKAFSNFSPHLQVPSASASPQWHSLSAAFRPDPGADAVPAHRPGPKDPRGPRKARTRSVGA